MSEHSPTSGLGSGNNPSNPSRHPDNGPVGSDPGNNGVGGSGGDGGRGGTSFSPPSSPGLDTPYATTVDANDEDGSVVDPNALLELSLETIKNFANNKFGVPGRAPGFTPLGDQFETGVPTFDEMLAIPGAMERFMGTPPSTGGGGIPKAPHLDDLDGDGIELVPIGDSAAFFDADNDGFLENMGWVGPDDGFLVYDGNGSGTVDHADELGSGLVKLAP